MKRAELVRRINQIARQAGLTAVWTEGGRHSKVRIGSKVVAVPRHREIDEDLARLILKQVEEGR